MSTQKWIAVPFPLRTDFLAQIVVPSDMTNAEGERLVLCIRSLCMPEVSSAKQSKIADETEAGDEQP